MPKYDDAIREIDVQISHLREQIAELERGRQALELLQDVAKINEMIPTSSEFKGLGWQEAARRLLGELRRSMRTRDILIEVQRRGLTSSAHNKTGTLSSALKQRPDLFTYNPEDGTWTLRDER